MNILKMRTGPGLLVLCLTLVVSCTETARETTQESQDSGSAAGSGSSASAAAGMNVQEQLAFAVTDLARRLGVEESAVGTAAVRRVTWRSGALGCPAPGMSYTDALVPGLLIILQVGEEGYGYHAGQGSEPFYCPRERVEIPASTTAEDIA